MSTGVEAGHRLEIGHVLFVDLVGYSKLLLDEQREQLQHLSEIVLNTDQIRAAEATNKLIRLPTGDGMALVFFNSPEAPVRCAIEISKQLKQHPRMKLRMGIHSGPVNEVRDVNGRANVAGAGINIAQRVMDCGDAGHILVSKRVAEDLSHSRQWRSYLHDLGECAVKHGIPISIVNLCTDEVGNAQLPEKIKQWQSEQAAQSVASSPALPRRYMLLAAAALLVGVAGFSAWLYMKQPPGTSLSPEKTIAVLPFQNFSPDKENAFFADGVQDDILTSLAKIKDLRVTSRSSVMKYRDVAEQNLGQIGKALGVANVLEGSVRREGDRVVVNVQLVDAQSARQIWANRYDRTLADSLGLQGELASEIADALRATLSTDEQAQMKAKPTQNPEAYVFYLRANQISRNPDTLLEDYRAAEQLYLQAIALDPDFALAHARLASVCAEIFHYYEPTDDWRTKARTEAQIALRLQPNLAEAHLALGQCIYWMEQDYDRALEQFDIAARLSPSNGDIVRLIAAIKRRQGKWEQALQEYERVAKLDPQNPNTIRELIFTNTAMRRWPEGARWVEQLREMAPTSIVAKIQRGYVEFWWKGTTGLLRSLVDQVPPNVDPDGGVTAVRWEVAMLDRDYAEAKRVIDASTAKEFSYTGEGSTPRSFFEGSIALARGDLAGAQKHFEEAQPAFENAVIEAPSSAIRHANLGWLYAFMGRKEDAIREGRRAVELKPESRDAVDGVIVNCYLALIYARVGEKDLAFPLLERLLKTPGAVDSVDYSLTINDLKHRWEWDPIRNDPRFQKLLEQAEK
ncbi:MAG TPA: tetratricopeptide repeat protein [Candidatus Udaeobacter sp.]|nr:tetratricopeptide repeat protein [Candidatus Udaeobacter sp.]